MAMTGLTKCMMVDMIQAAHHSISVLDFLFELGRCSFKFKGLKKPTGEMGEE